MVSIDKISELLSSLVAIDSVNPDLIPGVKGEGDIARFVAGWLSGHGLEVQFQATAKPGRQNVVAVARGSGGGRSLMLNAHLDTVGVLGMESPFSPAVRQGHLYGRGALDTKGNLAAFMLATAEAKRLNLRGDVILAAVVDEEYASIGTEALAREWKADSAIVGEPTGLSLVVAHKGFVWLEVETFGEAAHGSRPTGVDAIVKMGKVLSGIEGWSADLANFPPNPRLGRGSVHTSLIQGGQEISSYPAHCHLSLERRTIPGETVESVQVELQRILDTIAANDPNFRATARATFIRHPLEIPLETPIVEVLRREAARVLGQEADLTGMGVWTDAALLSDAGIPSVVFGPAGEGLHAAVEWVDLESVRQCSEIVLAVAQEFCSIVFT